MVQCAGEIVSSRKTVRPRAMLQRKMTRPPFSRGPCLSFCGTDRYGVTVAVRVAPAYGSQTATKMYQVPAAGFVTLHNSSFPASKEWQPGFSLPDTSGGTARWT